MVDQELRQAANDLRAELQHVTPPPFRPKSELGGRVLLVAATAAVFAIALALFTGASEQVEPADPDPEPEQIDNEEDQNPDQNNGQEELDPDLNPELETVEAGPAVTDTQHRAASQLDRPEAGLFSLEPEFETIIAGVTDVIAGGIATPIPGGAPSWNSDGSLLVLYETGELEAAHVLYDGVSFERLGPLPISPADIEEIYWDPVQANAIYFAQGDQLTRHVVNRGQPEGGVNEVVQTFDGCSLSTPLSQKPISANGQQIGLRCETDDGAEWIGLDLGTGQATRTAATGPDAPQPTASGDRFTVTDDAGTVTVLDSTLTPTGVTFQIDTSLSLVLQTTDGRDLLVTTNFNLDEDQTGSVVGYDLDTGEIIPAVGEATGFPFPPGGGTNLTASWQAPGLVVASIAGIGDPSQQDTLDGELLLVDFNQPEPLAYRLGHHRSHENSEFDSYRSTAWTAIDPATSRVLFSSHWGEDGVDTFVIDVSELRDP